MNEYLLLTPGPLTTSERVKSVMMHDWCTWDKDYNEAIVQTIRSQLVELASADPTQYTSVLMQGSGTASVEATLGTALGEQDKVLIINNGAYGARMAEIARYLKLDHYEIKQSETEPASADIIDAYLQQDPAITHIAVVHCETTTGMLNPIETISAVAKHHGKVLIVDAMSSFGGIPIDVAGLEIGYLISSANKCIQGVPGFGFVIAQIDLLKQTEGQARSLSLDLYAQWDCMEKNNGKWRFTSPTHVVRAFAQALNELAEEGGIEARHKRYKTNQQQLVKGMQALGFQPPVARQPSLAIHHLIPFPSKRALRLRPLLSAVETGRLCDLPWQSIGCRLLSYRHDWRSLRGRYQGLARSHMPVLLLDL